MPPDLETRNYKLSELVENETVILKYMSTERQVADLLTESLAKIAFERLRDDLIGYSCYNSPGNNIHALCIRITNTLAATINPKDQDSLPRSKGNSLIQSVYLNSAEYFH